MSDNSLVDIVLHILRQDWFWGSERERQEDRLNTIIMDSPISSEVDVPVVVEGSSIRERENLTLGENTQIGITTDTTDEMVKQTSTIGAIAESTNVELTAFKINVESKGIQKLLECPVCYDIILPPITLCSSGHSVCNLCKENLLTCPSCRGIFTSIRNLFAENFLDKCLLGCKYKDGGCRVILPGRELSVHQETCNFRPLMCRQCDQEIPYEMYLDHLRNIEKIDTQIAFVCSTGFEIEDEDLYGPRMDEGRGVSVWRPVWIHCHDNDFFCFLETQQPFWWIWVGGLAPLETCKKFVCSIMLWNQGMQTELKYVGSVHPLRTPPDQVLQSGQCLIFLDGNLKNFMYNGGIDVLVRIDIDTDYLPPKNCEAKRAKRIQMNPITPRILSQDEELLPAEDAQTQQHPDVPEAQQLAFAPAFVPAVLNHLQTP